MADMNMDDIVIFAIVREEDVFDVIIDNIRNEEQSKYLL